MAGFARAYAILGAQRATKILGIFARLDKRTASRHYLAHLPRVEKYLVKDLGHPVLAELKIWYETNLPQIFVDRLIGPQQDPYVRRSRLPKRWSSPPALARACGQSRLTLSRSRSIKVAGTPMIDHMLDRFVRAGRRTAIVNVHYLADQIEAHLAGRKDTEILISDERDQLLDQGGGIAKVAAPEFGGEPFFICNTDAFWIEGPKQNLLRLAEVWDPAEMDILLLVAATTASVGVDWAGDFLMTPDGRLTRRAEWEVAPFVYAGVGIMKPQLFAAETRKVFPLAPFFYEAARKGRLYGQRLDGLWLHVGAPQVIAEAEWMIARSVL